MTERACKNCLFYCPNENRGNWDRWDGECRRNPPNSAFPGVKDGFWCGEFIPKVKECTLIPRFQTSNVPLESGKVTTKPNPPPKEPKKPSRFLKF